MLLSSIVPHTQCTIKTESSNSKILKKVLKWQTKISINLSYSAKLLVILCNCANLLKESHENDTYTDKNTILWPSQNFLLHKCTTFI